MVQVIISLPSQSPAVYFPGDTVEGTVIVESNSVIATRSIYVRFQGTERCSIRQDSLRRNALRHNAVRVIPRVVDNTFFSSEQVLMGGIWSERAQAPVIELTPGTYRLPFSFRLPLATEIDLTGRPVVLHPSSKQSWKDASVTITYTLKAFLDIPNSLKTKILSVVTSKFHSKQATSAIIKVGGHSLLPNEIELGAKMPWKKSSEKQFLFQQGKLSVDATLDCKTYFTQMSNMPVVPGNSLDLAVTINNASQKSVKGVEVRLVQTSRICSHGYERTKTSYWKCPLKEVRVYPVITSRPETVKFMVEIPADLIPSTKAQFITVHYSLEVELVVDAIFAINLKTSLPLLILGPDQKLAATLNSLSSSGCPTQFTGQAGPIVSLAPCYRFLFWYI